MGALGRGRVADLLKYPTWTTSRSLTQSSISSRQENTTIEIMASATSFRQLVGMSPSTASVADSTLIIIDAQNEYAKGKLACSNTPSSRKAIASLLHKYREGNGKVVHVVHEVPEGAPVFTPNTELAEEFEELAPRQGEKVIRKHHPSAFAETDLHEHLGGGKIVLSGYMVSQQADDVDKKAYSVTGPCLCIYDCSPRCPTWVRCDLRGGRHWRPSYSGSERRGSDKGGTS